jgi:hypothetical protein
VCTTQKPILISLNKKDIKEFSENNNNYFAEHYYNQNENKDFQLTPLESYPFGWIVFSALLGAIGSILGQKFFVYIFSLVESFWGERQ